MQVHEECPPLIKSLLRSKGLHHDKVKRLDHSPISLPLSSSTHFGMGSTQWGSDWICPRKWYLIIFFFFFFFFWVKGIKIHHGRRYSLIASTNSVGLLPTKNTPGLRLMQGRLSCSGTDLLAVCQSTPLKWVRPHAPPGLSFRICRVPCTLTFSFLTLLILTFLFLSLLQVYFTVAFTL